MRLWTHVTGVGHVMRHDAWHVRDETSVVGLGLGGLRDGSGTEGGMSHNIIHQCLPPKSTINPSLPTSLPPMTMTKMTISFGRRHFDNM